MPVTTLVVTSQVIEIDHITDVAVKDIEHDDVAGDYFRDIVFFGEAPEIPEGTTAPIEGTIPTILRIRIRASDAVALHVSFPQGEF